MRKTLLALAFLFAFQVQGYSQSNDPGDIVTDRPDQTESADILQPGYYQFEVGINYERKSEDRIFYSGIHTITEKYTTAPALLRIGVFENFEFRIATVYTYNTRKIDYPPGVISTGTSSPSAGYLPLELGTKIKMTDESQYIPKTAFLFSASIPEIASGDFDNNGSTAEFRVLLSKTLSERFSLGMNLGAEYGGSSDNAVGLYTLSLAGEIHKNLGGFVEVYGNFADGSEPFHYVDGGLTYKIMKNLQIDFSAGTLYSDDISDFFIGGGISVRLPR